MGKKKLILLLLLFGIIKFSYAQTQKTTYLWESEPTKRKDTDRTHSLLHFDSANYYVFRIDERFKHTEIEVFDRQLQKKRTAIVSNSNLSYFSPMNLLGNLYLLRMSYRYNREEDHYENVTMRAFPLDKDSLSVGKDSITLVEPFMMKSNFYKGDFAISPDKSKILVYEYEELGDIEGVKALTNSVKLSVYDINFKLLWKRTIDLAPEGTLNRLVSLKRLRLSNDGKVGILTDIFKSAENRSYESKKVTANPTLFFVGETTDDFMRFTPNLGDYFYNQMDFTFDNVGDIIWFGCYSSIRYYQQSGLFYIKVNKERTKILAKKQIAFSPELIAKTLGKRISSGRELRNFVLAAWRMLPDKSGFIINLEHRPFSTFNFKSHQILSLCIDNDGNLRWALPTQKWGNIAQEYEMFLSHYVAAVGSDVYLIYNNGVNSENQAVAVRIDSKGQRTEKLIYRYDTQETLICPRLSYSLGDGKVFLCLQSRYFNTYNFAILDLPMLFGQK